MSKEINQIIYQAYKDIEFKDLMEMMHEIKNKDSDKKSVIAFRELLEYSIQTIDPYFNIDAEENLSIVDTCLEIELEFANRFYIPEAHKYTYAKVFDPDDMPNEVRKHFFDHSEKGNDCYVSHWVYDEGEGTSILDQWLLQNGCENGEVVIIEHSW